MVPLAVHFSTSDHLSLRVSSRNQKMREVGRPVVVALGALALVVSVASAGRAQNKTIAAPTDTITVRGIGQLVQVIRDRWGIAHIYAYSEEDLFFAQGYMAARDRLFQLEMWRRQATGTMAELLGPRELRRDIGARLFEYRGDMTQELDHYAPHSRYIIQSFVNGINAYVDEINRHPDQLPIEFKLLGTKPGEWTPDVVISRHQGLLGNVDEELQYGRAVAAVGPAEVKRIAWFHPGNPDLKLDPSINGALLSAPILAIYDEFRKPLRFQPSDIVASRNTPAAYERLTAAADSLATESLAARALAPDNRDIGSNNWVVSGKLTASTHPIMANDPHRAQSAPSLRSWVHLVAPGWDVHRWRRARDSRRIDWPQRVRGLGPHYFRHRRRGSVRLRHQPRRCQPVPLPRCMGTNAHRARDHPRQGRGARHRQAAIHAARPGGVRRLRPPRGVRCARCMARTRLGAVPGQSPDGSVALMGRIQECVQLRVHPG